jgi:hypothetical protein
MSALTPGELIRLCPNVGTDPTKYNVALMSLIETLA